MAQQYDVAGRLAEGREALAHNQTYVSACHRLGYRHPDLTSYGGQLADCYDSEAGLDLRLLDADCAALSSLADAADDALGRQRAQLAEFATAWRGPGAEAAAEFLRRHCDAGAQLTARLRASATGCAVLRDELWRLVDSKVAAVLALDEGAGAQRPAWLAAAHAVDSGAADEHATAVIEKQVMPYVDNNVRGVWVPAVRSASEGVAAAYRAAVAAVDPAPGVLFTIPGELGPVTPFDQPPAPQAMPVAPAQVDVPIPDAGERAASPAAASPASPAPAAPAAPLDDVPADLGMPSDLGLPSGLGLPADLGLPSGGLPTGSGGLGGLGGLIPRLADALNDPGFGEPFDDPVGVDERDPDAPEDVDDIEDDEGSDDPESQPIGESAAEEDAEKPDDAPTPDQAEVVADAEPVPENAAETEDPGPLTEAASDGPAKTPCEIAAEQLPQVGQ